MAKSPTPKSSWIGVIMPRTMFLSTSSIEDDEAEHPHRLGEETGAAARVASAGSPAGSSGGVATSGVAHRAPSAARGADARGHPARSSVGGFCTRGGSCRSDRETRRWWPCSLRGRPSWRVGVAAVVQRRSADAPIRTGLCRARPARPGRLRPARRAVARRRVHVGHLRHLPGRVGHGLGRSRATRWRCRRSSASDRRDLHERYAIEAVPIDRSWPTPTAWCGASSSAPPTAADLWAAVAEAPRAGLRRHAGASCRRRPDAGSQARYWVRVMSSAVVAGRCVVGDGAGAVAACRRSRGARRTRSIGAPLAAELDQPLRPRRRRSSRARAARGRRGRGRCGAR